VTLARDAIRLAAGDGLLVIEERRQHRAPNKPNIVRVVSREWRTWIMRGRGGGSIFLGGTDSKVISNPENLAPACGKDMRQAHDVRFRATGGGRGGGKAVGNKEKGGG
jgi:hypothetical protein